MSAKIPAPISAALILQGIESGEWSVTQQPLLADTLSNDAFKADVLRRLQLIEQKLGIPSNSFPETMINLDSCSSEVPIRGLGREDTTEEGDQYVAGLPDVRAALQTLVAWSTDKHNNGWSPHVIEALWLA